MTALAIPRRPAAPSPKASVLSKVPEATALFWFIKVLTTGMGECLSDTLVNWFDNPAIAGGAVALIAALAWQFRQDRFRTWPYWIAVAMVAVFGTMVADGFRKNLGLTYWQTTDLFAACLAVSLGAWWYSERTLSIHSITTRRREGFYWAVVMSTFALGTAVGDLCASTLHWGFLPSGLGFLCVIFLPYLAWRFLGLNAVVAFWASYIITRPLGASFADWAWVPKVAGGLGLGKDHVSVMLLPVFLVAVVVAARTRDGKPRLELAAA